MMSDRESLEISRAFHAGWEAHKMHMLTNGQRVWWCEVHRSEGSEPIEGYAICWYYGNAVAMNQRVQIEPCRIVSKLLSVYPKEAENE